MTQKNQQAPKNEYDDTDLDNDVEREEDNLDTRPQDVVEDDFVKIPKGDHKRIQKSLKDANKEAHKYRERLKAYQEFGDPEELAQRLQEIEEASEQQAAISEDQISRKELDKLRQRLTQESEQKVRQKDEEIKEMRSKLEQTVLLSQAETIIRKYDGKPELGLLDQVKKAAKVIEDNGRYVVRVVDEDGDPVFNDKGEYASLEDYVQELREHSVFGDAFGAPKRSGGGMRTQSDDGGSDRKGVPNVTKAQLKDNPVEMQKFFDKYGFEAYQKLKAS